MIVPSDDSEDRFVRGRKLPLKYTKSIARINVINYTKRLRKREEILARRKTMKEMFRS